MKCLFIGGTNDGKQIYVRDAEDKKAILIPRAGNNSPMEAEKYISQKIKVSLFGDHITVFAVDGMSFREMLEALIEGYRPI